MDERTRNGLGGRLNVDYSGSMNAIPIIRKSAELREITAKWREEGAKIAFVPTMGALHEGHLAHVAPAKKRASKIIVSIFVNPTQFAPHEDFNRYPRELERDAAKLASTGGVDLIYSPEVGEIYPDGATAKPVTDGPAAGLETEFRPHFFGGVVAVVERLFRYVAPDFATFGEKDYQQTLVVTRLARELDMGIEIIPIPIVREEDGLALSSRNAYLSEEERRIAPSIYTTIRNVAARIRGGRTVAEAEAEGAAALLSAGFERVDYCAVRDAETLRPIREIEGPARVLAAAWLGKTRLIDNIAL
jgi:pantoate--beta-alanine ligase